MLNPHPKMKYILDKHLHVERLDFTLVLDNLPFNDTTIGMGQAQGPSLRDQAERFLRAELHQIVIDLRDLNLFSSAQIVSRERATALGIA